MGARIVTAPAAVRAELRRDDHGRRGGRGRRGQARDLPPLPRQGPDGGERGGRAAARDGPARPRRHQGRDARDVHPRAARRGPLLRGIDRRPDRRARPPSGADRGLPGARAAAAAGHGAERDRTRSGARRHPPGPRPGDGHRPARRAVPGPRVRRPRRRTRLAGARVRVLVDDRQDDNPGAADEDRLLNRHRAPRGRGLRLRHGPGEPPRVAAHHARGPGRGRRPDRRGHPHDGGTSRSRSGAGSSRWWRSPSTSRTAASRCG